jgi:UDP-glucose 4-epimerase
VLKGAKVLVTGGAGFIGSTVARDLTANNDVTLLDNLHRDARQYVLGDKAGGHAFIKADVTDPAAMRAAIEQVRPTHIVHAAGIAGINTVGQFPVRTLEVNMLGTAHILAAAQAVGGVERVVTFSTSEIFGSMAFHPDEQTAASIGPVGEPRWVYATSKLGSEHLTFAYFKQYGLKTVSLRPFNVYGPGQVGEGALSIFIQRCLNNEAIELYGDGSQIRSWCYIDDMVQGVMRALVHDNAPGNAFNIGNPRSTETMYGLARMVIRLTQSTSQIRFGPKPQADIALRVPDIEWPRRLIDFDPQVELEDGIVLTAQAYRSRAAT